MLMSTPRRRPLLLLVATTAIVMSACGGGGNDSTGGPGSEGQLPTTTLNGSGSTFAAPYYETIDEMFQTDAQPDVTVNYNAVGSGQGQTDLQGGLTDFAGSDSLVKDEDVSKFKGGDFLYFPTVAAPITVSYNLSGVDELQLSAPTIAKIFATEIKTWDDDAIKADNPGVDLPSTSITVVHRSDGSGTTAQFTQYLTVAAPSDWTLGTDKTVNWPATTIGAEKNAGVADKIKSTNGAIGYVDYSDAKAVGLKFANVENPDGEYVEPTLETAAAALEGATLNADLTFDPLNAKGADAYPITSPTYIIVYAQQADAAQGRALKAYLEYVLGPGQDQAASVDFAKLPSSLLEKARAQIDEIQVP